MDKVEKITVIFMVYIVFMMLIVAWDKTYDHKPYNRCNEQIRLLSPNELKNC